MSEHSRAPITQQDPVLGQLRVIATTDLHMQLLGYDYFADKPNDAIGLINLVDTITALRAAPDIATVLCDNGDLIQGNMLADYIAARAEPHPMIAAVNLLQYDAMTLGNHEFDYGLNFLRRTLSEANFPIVSANIHYPQSPPPFTILNREVLCSDGQSRALRIGITGFAPPQIADWQRQSSEGVITADDILDAAQKIVPQMEAAGADLIVALSHSGIGSEAAAPRMENAAIPLAAVDGIDIVIAGHTHQQFPHRTHPASDVVDPSNSSLHGSPTVLPGSHGQLLGVIDCNLAWTNGAWTIATHTARLMRPDANTQSPLKDQISALVSDAHAQTLQNMRQPITQTPEHMQSYFATVQSDRCQQALAKAMQMTVRDGLRDSVYTNLPVLAATSAFRSGGQTGLGQYIDIPPGPLTRYDAAAIFPFDDLLYGVRRSGAQIAAWLERAVSYYCQIAPGIADQPLFDQMAPSYHCDMIFGLQYDIDLNQPARFDANGLLTNPDARRITALRHAGRVVGDDDQFIVATNSYRAEGGGRFAKAPQDDIVYRSAQKVRDVLTRAFAQSDIISGPIEPIWTFAPIADARATIVSSTRAAEHMPDGVTRLGPRDKDLADYQIRF